MIVPVLPFALTTRAGVPEEDVQQWVSILLAAYAAGLVVCSPICGYFADQSDSRRMPFLLGLFALTGANFMLCFGASITVLLIGRFLQGMAAAVVWAVGFAMAPETVGQERVGEAIGWVSLGVNLGALSGPVLGGVMFSQAGYYAVFGMTFGLLGLDILLRAAMIEKKVALRLLEEERQDGDEAQQTATETEPLIKGPDSSIRNSKQELSKPHAFPMLLFLQIPRFLSALWGVMVLSIMITAFDGVLPLYVHEVFGWESLGAGLIFLSTTSSSLLEPLFGHLADKYGTRWLGVTSFAVATPPYVLLRLITYNSPAQVALLVALLLVVGGCWSVGMTPLTTEVSMIVDEIEQDSPGIFGERGALAQAFGLTNVAFAVGSLIGPVWGGFMKEQLGWSNMTLSMGLLSAVTVIPNVS